MAAVVVVAVLAAGLVAVMVQDTPAAPSVPQAPDAATVAASFLAQVTTDDREQRLEAIRRYVEPTRAGEFVEAFDGTFSSSAKGAVGISAVPRAFRYVERSDEVAVVLVWSEVRWVGGSSWEVSGVGVARAATRWRVFSFEGTRSEVRPGDQRLKGFQNLELVSRTGGG